MTLVVSGLGVVSPLGCGLDTFWDRLAAGETAIAPAGDLDAASPGWAARVGELPVRDYLAGTLVRRMDRLARMMCVAAAMAAEDAGLVVRAAGADGGPLRHDETRAPADEIAVVAGSALGNLSESAQFLERIFGKGPALANPMLFPNTVMNAAASQLAIAFGWRGPNLTLCEGEVSGEIALEAAVEMLRRERARAVVVVAGDELSAILFRTLRELGVLRATGGERAGSSPFDARAAGPIAGEGAAALVLEGASTRRRAYAAVTGVRRIAGAASAPYRRPERPTPVAFASPPDAVFLGADGSRDRDRYDLGLAGEAVRGGARVTSIKGAVGEFGAAGLLTVVAAATSLSRGVVPPVAGLDRPIAEGARFVRRAEPLALERVAVVGSARGGSAVVVELARA